jgi:hypothetical protein
MKTLIAVISLLALAGCGAEVATTAATGAAIKKQEIEAGQKTKVLADKKIEEAAQAMQKRTEQTESAGK